jgi:hypothetical protein
MLYSIVKAQSRPDNPFEYFTTYDEHHSRDLICTLVESGFSSVQCRRIMNRILQYEEAIEKCFIGSANEQRLLQQYFDKQDKQ